MGGFGHGGRRQPARGLGGVRTAMRLAELDADELWLDYLALGGGLSRADLAEAIAGSVPLPRREQRRLTTAVNDALITRGLAFRVG